MTCLSESGSNAVNAGVAAANHYDSLVLCRHTDMIDISATRLLLLTCLQIVHSEVYALTLTTYIDTYHYQLVAYHSR